MATQQKQPSRTPAQAARAHTPAGAKATVAAAKDAMTLRPGQQLAEVPDHLKAYVGDHRGLEQADQSDFIIPRLAICQEGTPQRKKNDPKYIPNLEEGDLFNTVTGRIYGPRATVLPLFLSKQRIKFNKPMGTGIDCQSFNGVDGGRLSPTCRACPNSQFGPNGEAPACTDFKNIVSLVADPEAGTIPIVISCKSTGIKFAKQWISAMRMSNLPFFAKKYDIRVVDQTQGGKTFKQYALDSLSGEFVEKALFTAAEGFFTSLQERGVIVDTTGADEEQVDEAGQM